MKQGVLIVALFFATSGTALAQQPPRPAYPASPIAAQTIPGCGTIRTLPQLRICLKHLGAPQLRQAYSTGNRYFATPAGRQGKFWHEP